MIRYIRIALPLLLLCLAPAVKGQNPNLESLGFEPDARNAGFAGAGVALDANAFSLYRNMAGVAFSETFSTQASYSFMMLPNSTFHTIGGYYKLNENHSFAAGFRYFRTDVINMTENTVDGKEFRPYDAIIDLAYARRMTEYFSLSLNVRYVLSKISDYAGINNTANAPAIDLGANYRCGDLSIAATISNLGMLMDYGSGEFRMPANAKLGVAYKWEFAPQHRLTGSAEGRYNFLPASAQFFSGGVGAEYMYNGMFAVRGGYHWGCPDLSAGNYGSVGCGVYIGPITADFAYMFADPEKSFINNMWLVTAGVRF